MSDPNTTALNLNTTIQIKNTSALGILSNALNAFRSSLRDLAFVFNAAVRALASQGKVTQKRFADLEKAIAASMGVKKGQAGTEPEQMDKILAKLGNFGNVMNTYFNKLGKSSNPFLAQLGAMGPHMVALALVIEPVSEFLAGLMEPFSMLSDLFRSLGEVLGQAFMPIVMLIQPFLVAFIPILAEVAKVLAPILLLMFQFSTLGILLQILTPLLPLIQTLAVVAGQFMTIVAPILGFAGSLVGLLMTALLPTITTLITSIQPLIPILVIVTEQMTALFNWLTKTFTDAFTAGKTFIETIKQIIDAFKSFSWEDIGTAVTGGGADKRGWW